MAEQQVLLFTKLNGSAVYYSDDFLRKCIAAYNKKLNFRSEHHLSFDKVYNIGKDKFMNMKTNQKTIEYMKENLIHL